MYSTVYSVKHIIKCTVYCPLYSVQYIIECTVYSPVNSVQWIIQCTIHSTVYSVQYILQCTAYSTVYSADYCRPNTAFLAMAASRHTFKPRIFRLLHMMSGYKNFILQNPVRGSNLLTIWTLDPLLAFAASSLTRSTTSEIEVLQLGAIRLTLQWFLGIIRGDWDFKSLQENVKLIIWSIGEQGLVLSVLMRDRLAAKQIASPCEMKFNLNVINPTLIIH